MDEQMVGVSHLVYKTLFAQQLSELSAISLLVQHLAHRLEEYQNERLFSRARRYSTSDLSNSFCDLIEGPHLVSETAVNYSKIRSHKDSYEMTAGFLSGVTCMKLAHKYPRYAMTIGLGQLSGVLANSLNDRYLEIQVYKQNQIQMFKEQLELLKYTNQLNLIVNQFYPVQLSHAVPSTVLTSLERQSVLPISIHTCLTPQFLFEFQELAGKPVSLKSAEDVKFCTLMQKLDECIRQNVSPKAQSD